MFSVLLTAWAAGVLSGAAPAGEQPAVLAQLYVFTQHYARQKQKMEDHLDEVFATVKRAGYDGVQGWLTFHATESSAERVTGLLRRHKLSMPAAYAGGAMHTKADGAATIETIRAQAQIGAAHGLVLVVHNPAPLPREKTDQELAIQAQNLDRLGAALKELGVGLAIHTHDPEMRSQAREWYHMLKHTDPKVVGFCMDLHWVFRGKQDPYRLLEDAGKRTLDLHLRNSRDGVWSESLADGDIDHRKVKAILDRIGFGGFYTVELAYESATSVTRSLEENLRRSREYVRQALGR